MAIETIQQAITIPNFGPTDKDRISSLMRFYPDVAQQVLKIQQSFRRGEVLPGAAAATAVIVLNFPYGDDQYTPHVIPDWNTVCWLTAISETGFTITFSVACPGAGNILRYGCIA